MGEWMVRAWLIRMTSLLERDWLLQVRAARLPAPVLEYRFHPTRRWRFDCAWPEQKLAVELEGGIWQQGRHTRGRGFEADCRKYNAAVGLGWRALRLTDPRSIAERSENRPDAWARFTMSSA